MQAESEELLERLLQRLTEKRDGNSPSLRDATGMCHQQQARARASAALPWETEGQGSPGDKNSRSL